MTAALSLVVLLAGSPSLSVQEWLQRHPALELAGVNEAKCPAGGTAAQGFPAVLEMDLNGDARRDTAFVVRSRDRSQEFGVVVLNGTDTGPTEEHWVVSLRAEPIVGLGEFPSPYGQWLLVLGCTKKDGGTYSWDGKRYVPAPIL